MWGIKVKEGAEVAPDRYLEQLDSVAGMAVRRDGYYQRRGFFPISAAAPLFCMWEPRLKHCNPPASARCWAQAFYAASTKAAAIIAA